MRARAQNRCGTGRRDDANITRNNPFIHRARGEPLDRVKNAFSIISGTRSAGESPPTGGEDVHDRDTRVTASACDDVRRRSVLSLRRADLGSAITTGIDRIFSPLLCTLYARWKYIDINTETRS